MNPSERGGGVCYISLALKQGSLLIAYPLCAYLLKCPNRSALTDPSTQQSVPAKQQEAGEAVLRRKHLTSDVIAIGDAGQLHSPGYVWVGIC